MHTTIAIKVTNATTTQPAIIGTVLVSLSVSLFGLFVTEGRVEIVEAILGLLLAVEATSSNQENIYIVMLANSCYSVCNIK